jgi:cytochrome c553
MTRLQIALNVAVATLALGGGLLVASCSRTGGTGGTAGTADSAKAMSAEERIALGKHLSVVAGCTDCHTPGTFYNAPDHSRELSGSELGWNGPWGTTYPSNLTPDPETGLGSWNEEQIVTAIRTGKRPDGSPILPPMPWPAYSQFTDEEAYALAAYLKSIPPVVHAKVPTQPPGQKPTHPAFVLPAPSAWDAPRSGAAEGGAAPPPSGS